MNPEQKSEVPVVANPKPAVAVISDVVPVVPTSSTLSPVVSAPATPAPIPQAEPLVAPVKDKRRHFLAVFFFSFFFGIFGVDRFYLGKFWTGLLKLLTFGGFGFWAMIDLSLVISGAMRDKQGNEMIDAARYKKFAKRTVWGFTLIVLLIVIIIGGISFYLVMQFMQNGGIDQLYKFVPGFDQVQSVQGLQDGAASGQKMPTTDELRAILGL